jgi:hypothetical protein
MKHDTPRDRENGMTASTRRRITSDITDLNHGITKGFTAHDVEATIRRIETRAMKDLDQMAYAHLVHGRDLNAAKEYSTLLLAACRYTAAVKGQQAAQVEMEAASDNLITLGGVASWETP